MYILALNCGSSSLKYQVFDADSKQAIVGGNVEKIGLPDSFVTQKYPDGTKQKKECSMQNHNEALNVVMFMLREASVDMNEIKGVGHRVVMGGDKFASSVEINDEVIKTIDELSAIAPLHNPPALMGIVTAKQLLPNATQVAVFDTAFHQTMPDYAYRYAVPSAWYRELGVRRYGFHGTSHLYVSKRAAAMLGKPANECNLISLHIGSGASATAIRNGVCVDTSLGMTPLAGLTMGTRPGDLDPGVVLYVMNRLGLSADQMQKHLNKDSGLMGVTECFADRRDVEGNKDTNDLCRLAIDMEVDIIVIITKNNWLKGNTLKPIRAKMINHGIRHIVNYSIPREIFPDVHVAVSIFELHRNSKETYYKDIRNSNVVIDVVLDDLSNTISNNSIITIKSIIKT